MAQFIEVFFTWLFIIVAILFMSAPVWAELVLDCIGTKYGPKHCSIVWTGGCGGDIDLTKPDEDKLYRDWLMFRDFGAEYRYISMLGGVKTYGHVRDDHVEINGKRYYFSDKTSINVIRGR